MNKIVHQIQKIMTKYYLNWILKSIMHFMKIYILKHINLVLPKWC